MTTKLEGMMIHGKLKWYVILALALWLAFSGMAAAEQLYVNESGWWRDGGVFNASGAPIQAAVDAAGAGDAIYVHGGNYYENVDVDKPRLTLEGVGADVVTVITADSGDHVFEVTANYVNISGFTIIGAANMGKSGIYLNRADNCNISDNNASNSYYSIRMLKSSSNTLTNNTASNNNYGISLYYYCNNNTLTGNTANSNKDYGIWLDRSSNNTLIGNTASNNNYGISLYYYCNNNTLTGNTASKNYCGICLWCSSNNTIANNTASSNSMYGIYMYSSSNNNTLANNTAEGNDDGFGIGLAGSSNNTLIGNTANLNDYGICLYNADNNNINCNWVQSNTERGLRLRSGSTGNNISYNNIIENGNYNTSTGGWGWQFYNDQPYTVKAKHNYWGAGMNNSTIDASIYDNEEGGWGEVAFYPFETEPVPCAPTPKEPHTFTTTDAVIALQIAAGSRPPDLRWDVSGDGSVTSLDALMILQTAAGTRGDPITSCKDLDQNILRMYDEDGDGRIDAQWTVNAGIDLDEGRITQSEYDQVKYAYEHNCPVDVE